MLPDRSLVRRILLSVESFLRVEQASGAMLLVATAIALIWANSPWRHSYETLWNTRLIGSWTADFAINDGLMTLFFLVVGLEIRHEMREGALSDPRIATLPALMATAGVAVPALIYLLLNSDPVLRRGWAVPTATDIAFAVGVLSLVGRHAPPALRMLLLTLAIVDDIIAILIIATIYSGGIAIPGLALAGCGIVVLWIIRRLAIGHPLVYTIPGALLWLGMLRAGIHPTLAGVALGMLLPPTGSSNRILRTLHLAVAYVVLPLFALANAGVDFHGLSLAAGAPLAVSAGIVLGLVIGKPVGILLASAAALRMRIASLPEDIRQPHLALLGCLGGVGFTMSLFIVNLAFSDPGLLATAKCAVLVASVLAAVVSFAVGRLIRPRNQ